MNKFEIANIRYENEVKFKLCAKSINYDEKGRILSIHSPTVSAIWFIVAFDHHVSATSSVYH